MVSEHTRKMANADIEAHHVGRKSLDCGFIRAVFAAIDRVELAKLVAANPGKTVRHPAQHPRCGYVIGERQ